MNNCVKLKSHMQQVCYQIRSFIKLCQSTLENFAELTWTNLFMCSSLVWNKGTYNNSVFVQNIFNQLNFIACMSPLSKIKASYVKQQNITAKYFMAICTCSWHQKIKFADNVQSASNVITVRTGSSNRQNVVNSREACTLAQEIRLFLNVDMEKKN